MIYRRFGRTELELSVVTCGAMRFQHGWKDIPDQEIPAESQANVEATVRRALELGINHVETARGYGTSERQLGRVLPTLPRDEVIVQTKVGPTDEAKQFTSDFHDSLGRLKLDYVDMLGIHGLNNETTLRSAIRPGGCLAAARKLQADGKVRHVGFSSHGPTDVIYQAVAHEGDGGFDYVNLHWFYIFQKHWPAIELAAKRDMGVLIISPNNKGGKLNEPPRKLVDLCRPLHPITFNALFCLSHPEVHTISVGAAKPGDYDLSVRAVDLLEEARRILPPIVDRLDAELLEAVGKDLVDPFSLHLPAWHDTPGDINIPKILWLRNLSVAYDMVEYGKMRYNLLGSGGHWFPGNTAEKLEEVDLSGALPDCPLADRVPGLLREAHEMFKSEPVKRLSEGG
jgi:predicted aldo/keto reductase-like oxidoreductase